MALLSKSKKTPSSSHLQEWPALPTFNNTQTMYVDIKQWLRHPRPRELEKLPITIPTVIASIVKESTRNERYLQTQESQVVDAQIDVRSSKTEECVSCSSETPVKELASLQCQHKYCGPCVSTLAHMAMESEYLFPPRCCFQEIPLENVLSSLSSEEKSRYMRKVREYSTPHVDRWYCPSSRCGEWIPPEHLKAKPSGSQKCPYCSTLICSRCRSKIHGHGDCVSDDAVLEEARLREWQRCYNCGAMVELSLGCRHMTCRCKAEFCYECGKKWEKGKPCLCLAPELELAEDELDGVRGPTVPFIVAAMEYAEGNPAQEMERVERLHEEARGPQEREEETGARDPRQVRLVEERVKLLQAYLFEVNWLQQLSLINRHKEQALAFLSRQRARSFLGKLQRNVESRIRLSSQSVKKAEDTATLTSSALRSLVQELVYDRIWFDQVVAERENMLENYRLDLLSSGNDVEEELAFVNARNCS